MGKPRRRRGKGAWAEEWCRTHLGMEPLNRTAPLKSTYNPDGKIGTRYLVSVKSGRGKRVTIELDAWRVHAAAAYQAGMIPVLVLVMDEQNPVALLAGHPAEWLRIPGREG